MGLVSVIIPVLDEQGTIEDCISQFTSVSDVEVLVVDGGSRDRTRDIVDASTVARLVTSECAGRAAQMNLGASRASGSILLFLHADTKLPAEWLSLIRNSMVDCRAVGGRFRLAMSEDTWIFRLVGLFSTLRSRYFGITYGDQGIFVRRSAFTQVAGFPLRQIFEDSEFCKAVTKLGHFVMLDASVCSSTRRWRQGGIIRTVLWMWVMRLLYYCSVPDGKLSQLYRQVR